MSALTYRTTRLHAAGLVKPTDPPEVVAALLALREMGGRAEHLQRARTVLLARPIQQGEWLVVTAKGSARRYEHLCLDDESWFDAARVVRLTSALADSASSCVEPASGGVTSASSRPSAPDTSTHD